MTLPNMGLALPVRGSAGSGNWGDTLDADIASIDAHDHTTGKGARIPAAGINVNSDIPFSSLYAPTGLHRVSFSSVASSGMVGKDRSMFVSDGTGSLDSGELHYRNSIGFNVQVSNSPWVNVKSFGAAGNGVTDDTAYIQAAINATQGKILHFPKGKYVVSLTLLVSDSTTHWVGCYGARDVEEGTEIIFSGTGPLIQIGTDNGHDWDAADYDGPQGHIIRNIAFSHVAPNAALASTGGAGLVYRTGAYGVWDWRGGSCVFESCKFSGFEACFVGIQSDFSRLIDCTISNTPYGFYFGPRSDQCVVKQLNAFFCDRAITVDSAGQTLLENCSFAFCGTDTASGVEVRRGSHGTIVRDCWFEKSGAGYSPVSDSTSLISVGEVNGYSSGGTVISPGSATTPVNGCSIINPHTYTTLPGAYHTKYLVTAASVRGLRLVDPSAYKGGSIDNFDSLIAVQSGQTVSTTDSVFELLTMRDSAFAKLFVNSGTGSVAYKFIVVGDTVKTYVNTAHEFHVGGSATSALTTNATGTVAPLALSVTGDATLGGATTASHTFRGAIAHAAPGGGTGIQTSNTVASQTAAPVIWRLVSSGSYDTTAGALFPVGLVIADTSTRAAGGNSVGKTGVSVDVSTGTGLSATAITTARGNNDFNTGSSATTYFRKSIKYLGVATTNSVSTQQDNWSFTSMADAMTWILTITANLNITGFAATEVGHRVKVYNPTAFTATLKHLVTSSAANQIIGVANADTTIGPGITRELWYSTDSFTSGGKWVVIS